MNIQWNKMKWNRRSFMYFSGSDHISLLREAPCNVIIC